MQQQGTTTLSPGTRGPWSPALVAFLAFLAPPGGAMLTVDNLSRMGGLAAESKTRTMTAIASIFAAGLTLLLVLAQPHLNRPPSERPSTSLAISLGTAVASYIAQRRVFWGWRSGHRTTRTSSTASALLLTVLYTAIVFVAAVVLRLIIAAVMGDLG
ncbi:MAG TPA: hypothetical protein VFB58_08755 [Chloroflexota bacterium]|nr:hypothetical protein [Chloroflexota bacterium]